MNVELRPLPLQGPRFDAALAVYAAAFTPPPYNDPDRGREVRQRLLDVHRGRKGFAGYIACLPNGRVVGMIYGYHGASGQWWHDAVVRAVNSEQAARWFRDSYELVEIAVDPAFQGYGIGSLLIAALLEGRPEATCVLSTRTDSRAHHLYRRLGFEVIHTMRFSPRGADFFIMGRTLPYHVTAPTGETETAIP